MKLPSKIFEQIAFNTRSRIEKHTLVKMKKPTQKEYLSEPLQNNNKKSKTAVTF